jgi:hypothetical protein
MDERLMDGTICAGIQSMDAFRILLLSCCLLVTLSSDAKEVAPVPTHDVSLQDYEANRNQQQIVRQGDRLIFIDQGRLFEKNLKTGAVSYFSGQNIRTVLNYRGQLIALTNESASSPGTLFLWDPKKGTWIDLEYQAKNIFVVRDDLVIHTRNNGIWAFKGAPGNAELTWTPGRPLMFLSMTQMIPGVPPKPMWDGRVIELRDLGLRNVQSVSLVDSKGEAVSDLEFILKDGKKELYTTRLMTLDPNAAVSRAQPQQKEGSPAIAGQTEKARGVAGSSTSMPLRHESASSAPGSMR